LASIESNFFAILFIALVLFPHVHSRVNFGDSWDAIAHIAAGFAPSFSLICAGVVIAAYEVEIARLLKKRFARYISCTAGLLLISVVMANTIIPPSMYNPLSYKVFALSNGILPICIAWLIINSIHQTDVFTTVLIRQPLPFLGMISYSLYLWQQLFTGRPSVYLSDALLPLMFIAAILSFYFVERPSVRLGKRLLQFEWAVRRQAPA
jgi:peptidoglycan/LPS O-acetylase OafA/YrhL